MTTTVKMVLIIMKPKTLKKSAKRNLVVMIIIYANDFDENKEGGLSGYGNYRYYR